MKTTDILVRTLFDRDVQYIIPLFQRHYVWDEENQWAPLWEDITKKVDQNLSKSQMSHFTGAVVVHQKLTSLDEVPKFEIIDGQQRLTTFQIIFCALRDRCLDLEETDSKYGAIAKQADRYILNQEILTSDFADEEYKLMPTKYDRDSFQALVKGNATQSSGNIKDAYGYFKQNIVSDVGTNLDKMRNLFNAIRGSFSFVQILLDPDDEPERIFESLNARGKPLLQFDLLRNNLFMRAGEDRDRLYGEYWEHFENSYWENEVTVARSKITLSELFFLHFLIAKLGEEDVTPLFNVYQRNLTREQNVESELSKLKRYSEVYKEMTDCAPDSEIGQAMSFYKTFDITTVHPFILFVINGLKISDTDLSEVLRILESYTMRRLLCFRLTATKSYTQFFSRVIRQLKGNRFNLEDFISLLSAEKAKSSLWPTDSEVRTFLNLGADAVNKNVVRYILYRIELMKRESNRLLETDALVFDKLLTLEHIMPEKWQRTWSLPLLMEDDNTPVYESERRIDYQDLFLSEYRANNPEWETGPSKDGLADEAYDIPFLIAERRNELLQSMGNLTLATGRHNSKMSNKPFSEKKASLFRNSLLVLNKEISGNTIWDVPQISRRTEDLFDHFCSIWPSAKDFAESTSQ